MERRNFIRLSTTAIGALTIPRVANGLKFEAINKNADDKILLGNTGIEVSRLAVGTGSSGWGGSSNQTRQLGLKGLADLLHYAYDHNVYFWDSADQYGTHPHLKEALKTVPREKVVILTKTHASTEKEMKEDLDRFRKEIGTDYIDIVLLHCMTKENWPELKQGAMDVLSVAREDKIVRAHGVSCHTFPALQAAAKSKWVQVDLARINYAGVVMDSGVDAVSSLLTEMNHSGKAIIGMKILGDGKLAGSIDKSLKFALTQSYFDSFTIGFENKEQFMDVVKRISSY
ncbi:MAG: aldo/keto reductase [Bacteroidales bacterium]|nr:aldo/keto reductase [Bacteroidales bacterium]